jgi:hypothetical protein
MAISIDNVYQQVLAIANKEQRGYITPQEFNLLSRKAQLDIFEGYFHDYKEELQQAGNQSKLADDLDILREKIAKHRVIGTKLTAGNTLPTDLHWLETIYRSPLDYRRVSFTAPASSAISDGDSIHLKALLNTTSDEGDWRMYFNTSGDVTSVQLASIDYVLNMVGVTWTATVVATKIAEAINKYSPYHSATSEGAVVTITYSQLRTWTGSETLSSSFGSATVSSVSGIDNYVVYEEVDKENWSYIMQNTKLKPTTSSRGIFYKSGLGGTIQMWPDPGSDEIYCDYIKRPANPKWTYVVVKSKALYNASASDKQDFELHSSEESALVNKILELAGIVMNKPGLSEVILRNEQLERGHRK